MAAIPLKTAADDLIAWYRADARPLPWRLASTPYRVWVSEVMLQQTRIEAVIPYFERFMAELPTVRDLADVADDRLMKLWEGLGYYSRARNLKKAAGQIVSLYGGELPADYDKLLALPGFGAYTAGAVASIAFGIPVPAVDGNVLRVVARLTADMSDVMQPAVKRQMTALVRECIPQEQPGIFNSALMELGERICLPNTVPRCTECPLAGICRGYADGVADKLPVRSGRRARRAEQMTVLVIRTVEQPSRVLLHRRAPSGLLAGMWELPHLPGHCTQSEAADAVTALGGTAGATRPLGEGRHLFTHVEWQMTGIAVRTDAFVPPDDYVWTTLSQLSEEYALPSAFRPYARLLPILLEKENDCE